MKIYISDNYIIVEKDNGEIDPYSIGKSDYDEFPDHFMLRNVTAKKKEDIPFLRVPSITDDLGVPYTVASLRTLLRRNTGFSSAAGGSAAGTPYRYVVDTYDDLLLIPGPVNGDIARVYRSQGIWLINRKSAGAYTFTDGEWKYGSRDLQAEVEQNDADIAQLAIDLQQEILDRQSADSDKLDSGGYSGTGQNLRDALDIEQTTRENEDLVLRNDIDQEALDRQAVDEGSVTVHSDVNDAGREAIITNQEANDIYDTVDVHNDTEVIAFSAPDGTEMVVQGGVIRRKPEVPDIESPQWTTTTNDIDTPDASNVRIDIEIDIPEAGLWRPILSLATQCDSTGQDMVVKASLGGQSLSLANITTQRIQQLEGKDSGSSNPDNPGGGTDQVASLGRKLPSINLPAGPVRFLLEYGPSGGTTIEASVGDIVFELKRVYNVRIV